MQVEVILKEELVKIYCSPISNPLLVCKLFNQITNRLACFKMDWGYAKSESRSKSQHVPSENGLVFAQDSLVSLSRATRGTFK